MFMIWARAWSDQVFWYIKETLVKLKIKLHTSLWQIPSFGTVWRTYQVDIAEYFNSAMDLLVSQQQHKLFD